MPPSMCPRCGRLADGAMEMGGDRPPQPGDLTVCINCVGVSSYDARLQLVRVDAPELAAMEREQPGLAQRIRKAQREIALAHLVLGP
ncbi:MAG TPA: hypothetical protein VGR63_15425, partial [Casimicrobiaceae bacterium]|nr:hypothetical protein [Casimicrobiaceae bacterium]